MIQKMVHYRVKPAALSEVEKAIQEFIQAISEAEPRTIYSAYRTAEKTEFIHFMAFPHSEAETYHQNAAYTKRFVGILYPNVERLPQFTDLLLLASASQENL